MERYCPNRCRKTIGDINAGYIGSEEIIYQDKNIIFCSLCGKKLKSLVCSNCNKEIYIEDKYCRYCGSKIEL